MTKANVKTETKNDGLDQCCPSFLTPHATQEINLEVAGHISKLKAATKIY